MSKNLRIIFFYITIILFLLCITYAAIYFERISILFFYILPTFTALVHGSTADYKENNESERDNGSFGWQPTNNVSKAPTPPTSGSNAQKSRQE